MHSLSPEVLKKKKIEKYFHDLLPTVSLPSDGDSAEFDGRPNKRACQKLAQNSKC
jgi:hypothetical protein